MKTKLLLVMALFKLKKKRKNTVTYQPHSATLTYSDKLSKLYLQSELTHSTIPFLIFQSRKIPWVRYM